MFSPINSLARAFANRADHVLIVQPGDEVSALSRAECGQYRVDVGGLD
jgi:hypothetical protein